jgi:methyltransferase (TIGR00027 family)
MPPETHEIGHVSDTALMTAACRALETDHPNGLIRDPFAARLAGARGMAIARALHRLDILCFGIGIRSRFLDHLVLDTVAQHGIVTVLSLGAGLDSRPWRLELPASLRWVEVDFPEMLDYKDGIMASAPPKCRRERLAADINDPDGRQTIFAAAAAGPTLMITEGLLMYLPASTIETLAAGAPVSHWLLDVASAEMRQRMQMNTYQSIENVRAADHIEGAEILDVLHRHGWTGVRSLRYAVDSMECAADRIKSMFRNVPPDQIPKPMSLDDLSGVHLYGRQSA